MDVPHLVGTRAQPRPGAPGRFGRAILLALAGALAASAVAASGASSTSAPPPASAKPASAATERDCTHLLKQFDVAWPAHRQSPHAASARHSRDLGETDCSAGHYAEGVHHLRRALHDIGVKPVTVVAPRAAR